MKLKRTDVKLNSQLLPCFVGGEGPPILFLHSSGGVRLTPAVERLAGKYRIHMPIIPGFDGTEPNDRLQTMHDVADLAAEFIETQIKGPCDVIGHSFGGRCAAWLAITHPELVQLLILAAASIRPNGEERPGGSPEDARRRLFAHPENLPPETKPAGWLAKNRAASQRLRGSPEQDAELLHRLKEIRTLTLILYGTKDGEIPPSSAQFLKSQIPKSMLIYVYDAAHAIDSDQPENFVRLVDGFFSLGETFIVARGKEQTSTLLS
jgi:pimeloyl-ACP methyl ester carboxylesterase